MRDSRRNKGSILNEEEVKHRVRQTISYLTLLSVAIPDRHKGNAMNEKGACTCMCTCVCVCVCVKGLHNAVSNNLDIMPGPVTKQY